MTTVIFWKEEKAQQLFYIIPLINNDLFYYFLCELLINMQKPNKSHNFELEWYIQFFL